MNFYITNSIEDSLKSDLDKEEFEINSLKSNTDLTPEDWVYNSFTINFLG